MSMMRELIFRKLVIGVRYLTGPLSARIISNEIPRNAFQFAPVNPRSLKRFSKAKLQNIICSKAKLALLPQNLFKS